MPALEPHYHVGIVVPDVAEARARLRAQLGVVWGPIMHLDEVEYADGSGAHLTLPTTLCYSAGSPSLELIEEAPGTVWVRNPHSNLHHIGFWTSDLDGDSRGLVSGGCPLQLCGRAGDAAPVSFTYHHDDDLGIRYELVDAAMRDAMAFLFTPDPTQT
jgi:catechol 2,3-dioxygenase-like lactoylglutathione lyase family enzyme